MQMAFLCEGARAGELEGMARTRMDFYLSESFTYRPTLQPSDTHICHIEVPTKYVRKKVTHRTHRSLDRFDR